MKTTKKVSVLSTIALLILLITMLAFFASCNESQNEGQESESREVSYSKTIYCDIVSSNNAPRIEEKAKPQADFRAILYYNESDVLLYAEVMSKYMEDILYKYEYNQDGQLVTNGIDIYEYDAAGNCIKKSDVENKDTYTTYEFDANNNIVNRSEYANGIIRLCWIKEYNSNGDLTKEIERQYSQGIQQKERIGVYEYNSEGQETKYSLYINNEFQYYTIYEYSGGNKSKSIEYSPDGTQKSYIIYDYGDNGSYKTTGYESYGITVSEQRYDEYGNLTFLLTEDRYSETEWDIRKSEMIYDEKGNLIEKIVTADASEISDPEKGLETHNYTIEYIYEYDEKDNLIKESYGLGGKIFAYVNRIYDDRDICISSSAYNAKGDLIKQDNNYLVMGTGVYDWTVTYSISYNNDSGVKISEGYYPDTHKLSEYVESSDNYRLIIQYDESGNLRRYDEDTILDNEKRLSIFKYPLGKNKNIRVGISLTDDISKDNLLSIEYDSVQNNDSYIRNLIVYDYASNGCVFSCEEAVSISDVEITDTDAKVRIVDADNKEVVIVYTFSDQKLTVN